MNSNFRKALLAAAGLVVLSLPASAAGSQAVTDSGLLNTANTTKQMQLAQRPYDPSAGSVGFKKSKKKKAKK
jgi:hypothetical protein